MPFAAKHAQVEGVLGTGPSSRHILLISSFLGSEDGNAEGGWVSSVAWEVCLRLHRGFAGFF